MSLVIFSMRRGRGVGLVESALVYRLHSLGTLKRKAYFLGERKLLVYEKNAMAAIFNVFTE